VGAPNPQFEGLVAICGLEERAFANRRTERPTLSWDQFDEIPPVLVVRLRRI